MKKKQNGSFRILDSALYKSLLDINPKDCATNEEIKKYKSFNIVSAYKVSFINFMSKKEGSITKIDKESLELELSEMPYIKRISEEKVFILLMNK